MEARSIEIAPLPTWERIAVGKTLPCGECEDGRIEDTKPGLERVPFTVYRDCPICDGRGKYPQMVAWNEDYIQ